ncbi:MAG: peptidase S10, partial [Acetobacteraceae bacterium]|nr:peptidase S10 [Acetobacteraceae bacterium]
MRKTAAALTALLCLSPALALAAEKPAHPSPTARSDEAGQQDKATTPKGADDLEAVKPPVAETASVSHGSVTVNGRAIAYTATAGTVTIRDDEGKPTASMFYVAYTADGARHNPNRPVTFFYNGGPGSSSMWLHLGSLAPVRVFTDAPNPSRNAPFNLGPNPDSLIDKSDLVFVDAIGTGYSRPLGDAKGTQFWGVDQDADAFARGIQRYLSINDRWNSPKFLFGESYGTTRSGALAYQLQDRGVQLNGVVLLSSILNYGIRTPGFDNLYVTYLPSYAATAWYHNRLQNKPADLEAFLREVRGYARGPYLAALAKGQDITPQELDAV